MKDVEEAGEEGLLGGQIRGMDCCCGGGGDHFGAKYEGDGIRVNPLYIIKLNM